MPRRGDDPLAAGGRRTGPPRGACRRGGAGAADPDNRLEQCVVDRLTPCSNPRPDSSLPNQISTGRTSLARRVVSRDPTRAVPPSNAFAAPRTWASRVAASGARAALLYQSLQTSGLRRTWNQLLAPAPWVRSTPALGASGPEPRPKDGCSRRRPVHRTLPWGALGIGEGAMPSPAVISVTASRAVRPTPMRVAEPGRSSRHTRPGAAAARQRIGCPQSAMRPSAARSLRVPGGPGRAGSRCTTHGVRGLLGAVGPGHSGRGVSRANIGRATRTPRSRASRTGGTMTTSPRLATPPGSGRPASSARRRAVATMKRTRPSTSSGRNVGGRWVTQVVSCYL